MNTRIVLHGVVATTVALIFGGCAKDAASASDKSTASGSVASAITSGDAAPAGNWTSNGATACDKYLTPDVVASILKHPAGKDSTMDATSCRFQGGLGAGAIYITLKVADIDVFKLTMPRIQGAHPFSGVGDAAFWNEAGAMSSVKGHTRGCDINVLGVPDATKKSGEELAKQVGDICNKLYALP